MKTELLSVTAAVVGALIALISTFISKVNRSEDRKARIKEEIERLQARLAETEQEAGSAQSAMSTKGR
jgi:hypothetical protein